MAPSTQHPAPGTRAGTRGGTPWQRNVYAVTAASFMGYTGFTVVMPFLPLFIGQLGVSDVGRVAVWTGVSLGVTPGLTAILAPAWGRLGDRYGRKIMVERSMFSFVVLMAAMAYVTRAWHVLALRIVQGLFAGYGSLSVAMAAESAPRDRMPQAIGLVQTAQRLGPAVGPVIGGALAGLVGLRRAFLVTAAFYALGLVVVHIMYQELGSKGSRGSRGSQGSSGARGSQGSEGSLGSKSSEASNLMNPENLANLSNQPNPSNPANPANPANLANPANPVTFRNVLAFENFVLMMAVIFGLQFVDRSFGPILPLYVEHVGVSSGRVAIVSGVLFSIMACTGALGHHFCGRLMRRYPTRLVIVGGATAAAIGCALLSASGLTWVMSVASAVFGVGIGAAMTAAYSAAGRVIPAGAHGTGFGVLTSASLVGMASSPLIAGLLGGTNIRAVFFVDLALMTIVAIVVEKTMVAD